MKISIGINGYKQYKDLQKRERFCIESLLKCKNNDISLFNIVYDNESVSYEGINTLQKLTKTSDDIIRHHFAHEGLTTEYNLRKQEIDNNTKKIPSVKEIFDVLCETDCDYFLFLNNCSIAIFWWSNGGR